MCTFPLRAVSVVLVCLALPAKAQNWPQWRGPTNDGISQESRLPTEWSDTKNVAWKLALPGMGGSTPIVWDDRIFLTTEDGNDVALLCVSTEGRQLWKQRAGMGKARFRSDEANQASPSPCTDGKLVFAFFGTGDFICVDLEGKLVWRFNAQDRYGRFEIQHGMHVTPLLHGDRLYLSLLHSGGWWVVALDKFTGNEIWKVRRASDAKDECEQSYASPVLWRKGDQEYLIVHGCDYATAHRLDDGSEIWRLGDLNPRGNYNNAFRLVASPVAVDDLIVVPTAKNGPVVGVKPDASGLVSAGTRHEQWRRPSNTPDVPSPLIHHGLVYLCREMGVVICMDAQSGQEYYQERIHSARYRASPVYADGKIYLTARDGMVTVIKSGPKFEVLATNQLRDQIAASPAVSRGRIYLRGFETLYAIGDAGK